MNLNNKNTPFFQAYPQIPLFPIYGYDNSEEAEKDFDYMKQLYPRSSVKIQELIEEACDKLEYEGSIMFDEYPDRLQLALLANNIYHQVAPSALSVSSRPDTEYAAIYDASDDSDDMSNAHPEAELEPEEELVETASRHAGGFPGRPGRPMPPPGHPGRPMPPPPPPPPGRPMPPPPWRPAPPPPGSDQPNWLRNLIEVMLCNEMCQRRRRYRSRKRWM